MKKLVLCLILLATLAARAGTAPAFSSGLTSFAGVYTNNLSTYGPRGVAVADLFGTGQPALISANSQGNYLTIFTNNSAGSFGLNARPTVGGEPVAVVATNINGSGHIDLLTLNEGISTVSVLTNNGAGAFTLSSTIELPANSGDYSFTVADIYNNGKPAVIAASESYSALLVYTNAGGGFFGSNATCYLEPIDTPLFVTAADINGDGFVDLICASEAGVLTVLTNNGSGGFVTSQILTNAAGKPAAVTVADIYNNGRPALIVANESLNNLEVYTNAGTGRFGSNTTCNVQYGPISVTAADVNGDGFPDLICANNVSASLMVLTNNGSGGFTPALTNFLNFLPVSVTAASLFGTGKPDLVTCGGGSSLLVLSNTTAIYQRPFTVQQYTNLLLSAGGSPAPAFSTTGPLPGGLTLIDHGNGTATLGGTPVIGSGGVYHLSLTASNTSGIATQAVTLTISQPPVFTGGAWLPAATNLLRGEIGQLTVADLFGTGQPALTYAYYEDGNGFGILTNAGGGGFGANALFNTTYVIDPLLVADVYGTGRPALITVAGDAGTVGIFTNNGSGSFGLNDSFFAGGSVGPAVTADIFGTGKLALIAITQNDVLTILTNNATNFHTFSTLTFPGQITTLATADVNGDGFPDLICGNSGLSTLTVLTNNGRGAFTTSQSVALPANYRPATLAVADIYNNGQPALITSSAYYGTLIIYTNAGGGLFGPNATNNVYTTYLQVADVNNDGHLDLVTANNNGDLLTVLTNNGAGRFLPPSQNSGPTILAGVPTALTTADINGDGRADLLYSPENHPGTVVVWTNTALVKLTAGEDRQILSYTTVPPTGWPAPGLAGTAGTLPAGLTFTHGTLSGATGPGTAGTYDFILIETNALGTNTETIALTVQPAITTSTPTLNVDENVTATITAQTLVNSAYDQNGYTVSLTGVSPASAAAGLLVSNLNGLISYTPPTNFTGADTFTYTLADTAGDTATGTVYINLYPPPVPGTTILSTPENTSLVFPGSTVLANDRDPAGQPLDLTTASYSGAGGPVYSEIVNGSLPAFVFLPLQNFTGLDTIAYTLADTLGGTAPGIIQVLVTAPGSPAYNLATITATGGSGNSGQLTLLYTGLPDTAYYLQTAPALTGPWTDAPPATTDANGLLTIPITATPALPAQYYRLSVNP